MKRNFLLVLAALFLLSSSASAHKGRTDANGGHYDHSTGEYHYHHGYPAHQHVTGICPYDFDDKTNHSSGRTSSQASIASAQFDISHSSHNSPVSIDLEMIFGIALLCCLAFSAVFAVFSDVYSYYRGKKQKEQKRLEKEHKLEMDYQIAVENTMRLEAENIQLKEEVKALQQKNAALSDEVYVLIAKKNHSNESLPPHQREQEEANFECGVEFEQNLQKARFAEMFAGESLLDLAGAPFGVEIGPDGLPKDVECEGWGPRFTFYTAQKGNCFHARMGCSGAYTPIHLLKADKLQPCSRCCHRIPQTSWYDEYLRLKEIKDRYGIE